MRTDSVSVVIPCHAHEHFLFRALSSIIWQLRENDDVIIVHDSKETMAPEITAPFGSKVKVIENGANKGVSFSRNRAIEASTADWIKFLDADDVLAPFALEAVRGGVDLYPETQVLAGGANRMLDGRYADYCLPPVESFEEMLFYNPTLPSYTIVRRPALVEVGMFDERIDFEEDWDLWLRIFKRYSLLAFQIVNQPFCYYWISQEERKTKKRVAMVEGLPVREYFRKVYGADPYDD